MSKIRNILFVCTGNICRSPMAEAVMRCRLKRIGQDHLCDIDSAGTQAYHVGDAPDHRTLKLCYENGVNVDGLSARVIEPKDYEHFDLILGLDKGHVEFLKEHAPAGKDHKIGLFMEYAGHGTLDVPDPYYGDIEDFIQVFEMVSRGTESLLNMIFDTSHIIAEEKC
ncbi:MAG: low molecular weight phosphotyrosine protein phosphatase [Alphaproteobacteria bacterium]|nr:low molecular weight phosphotyrosine protein phosphatase [Alphaproteobacteria bacterium]